jgi:hypothetical protein
VKLVKSLQKLVKFVKSLQKHSRRA